jgi:hypothetical protein
MIVTHLRRTHEKNPLGSSLWFVGEGHTMQREGPAESPQEGGRPSTSFALPGYPRSRKNGGHSEAGKQPCRFIARRATNGAPPSEAT